MRKLIYLSFLSILFLSGCANHFEPEIYYEPYGFFSGLWHGAIAGLTITVNILSWILSLIGISFFHEVQIIGRPNTGFFYYVGFFFGWGWLPVFR